MTGLAYTEESFSLTCILCGCSKACNYMYSPDSNDHLRIFCGSLEDFPMTSTVCTYLQYQINIQCIVNYAMSVRSAAIVLRARVCIFILDTGLPSQVKWIVQGIPTQSGRKLNNEMIGNTGMVLYPKWPMMTSKKVGALAWEL